MPVSLPRSMYRRREPVLATIDVYRAPRRSDSSAEIMSAGIANLAKGIASLGSALSGPGEDGGAISWSAPAPQERPLIDPYEQFGGRDWYERKMQEKGAYYERARRDWIAAHQAAIEAREKDVARIKERFGLAE